MADKFSMEEARMMRLRSQRLHPENHAITVKDAIASLCGVQAQDLQVAALAVRAHCDNITTFDVRTALLEDRSILRTWCMRGSLHLIATRDAAWLLSVFGPVFADRSKKRLADLGFDDEACNHAMKKIGTLLADRGPLTRDEIATSLEEAGIDIDPNSQAPITSFATPRYSVSSAR